MFKIFRSKKGVTLLEILLAVTILVVATLPIMSFVPSTAKITYNTQEEQQLNQELRSTIIKVTDVMKDKNKSIKNISGDPKNKADIMSNVQADGSFESSDYYKVSDESQHKIKLSGTVEKKESENMSSAGGVLFTKCGTAGDASNIQGIDYDVFFFNAGSTPIYLKDLTFKYFGRFNIKDTPTTQKDSIYIKPGGDGSDDDRAIINSTTFSTQFSRLNLAGVPITYHYESAKVRYRFVPISQTTIKGYQVNGYFEMYFDSDIKDEFNNEVVIGPKCYAEFHPKFYLTDWRFFDLTNDLSFMSTSDGTTDAVAEQDLINKYANASPTSPAYFPAFWADYHLWDRTGVYHKGIPIWGKELPGQNNHGYTTELYKITIELFNKKDQVAKKAYILVNGN